MCEFIPPETYILPGWACCQDRVYNGLQRPVCKACGRARCPGVICVRDRAGKAGTVLLCPTCGAGYGPKQVPQDGRCLVSGEGKRCEGRVGERGEGGAN